jgi:hypothetical protein
MVLSQLPSHELREELNMALYETQAIMAKTGELKSVGVSISDKRQYSTKLVILLILTFGGIALGIPVIGRMASGASIVTPNLIIGGTIVSLWSIIGCVLIVIESLKNVRKAKISLKFDLAQLLESTVALPNIPVEYCNDVALEYMVSRIDKGVASTWKECVEQYEQQVHRWTVEENTAEAARYAKSAARSARWAAIGAWRRGG